MSEVKNNPLLRVGSSVAILAPLRSTKDFHFHPSRDLLFLIELF